MRNSYRLFVVAGLALALAACQSSSGSRRELGRLLTPDNSLPPPGAEPGPGLAQQGPPPNVSSPGGSVQGGLSSSEIGRALDEMDRLAAGQAELVALQSVPAGSQHHWQSNHSSASGTVVPGETYQINQSECRDYTHTVTIDGSPRPWRGTACRQPNGSWRAVNS